MNGTRTALEHTEIPGEPDWALAGIPDGINATGLLAEDLEDGGLTEVQTLILACVATVIPLFLGLLLVLGVRMVWKKYKNHNTNSGYDNDGLHREDSCDAVKSSSFMQSAEELKTSESQYSVLMPDDAAAAAAASVCCYAAADASTLPPLLYNSPPNNRFGDTNKTNLNGSIITLTMKNNHLIVETEERVPGICMANESAKGEAAAAAAAAAVEAAKSAADYEYDDDDEFDMEAEILRREFREASLLANGDGGGGQTAAVLEPSSQTQVDLTADRRPMAAVAPHQQQQLQQPVAADHSSGGSSSADSRVAEMAYAYGNQSEYTAADIANKHYVKVVGGGQAAVKSATVKSAAISVATTAAVTNNRNHNHNNNNDDEYLVEQRLLGNGVDGGGGTAAGSPPPPLPPPNDICSPDGRVATTTAAQ